MDKMAERTRQALYDALEGWRRRGRPIVCAGPGCDRLVLTPKGADERRDRIFCSMRCYERFHAPTPESPAPARPADSEEE
jgi:hypothetical protein